MKKILVPTDFSDGAFNALEYALHFARLLNFSVEVVHAYNMPATGSMVMVDITEIIAKNTQEELDLLKNRVDELSYAKDIQIVYRKEHGTVVDMINRVSREAGFEFAVMGTQGSSGITDKWLGTNAMDAVKFVEDPLMIVPANHTYKNMDHILFATDLKLTGNEDHLKFLSLIAEKSSAKIEFLHIRKQGENVDDEKLAEYQDQLNRTFGESRPRIAYLYDNEVHEGIEEAIESKRPELLVVVRHKYGFFEGLFKSSVSKQLISKSKLPILVLQDK